MCYCGGVSRSGDPLSVNQGLGTLWMIAEGVKQGCQVGPETPLDGC